MAHIALLAGALLALAASLPAAGQPAAGSRRVTLTVQVQGGGTGEVTVRVYDDRRVRLEQETRFETFTPAHPNLRLSLTPGPKQVLVFFPPHPPSLHPMNLQADGALRVRPPSARSVRVRLVVRDAVGLRLSGVEAEAVTRSRPALASIFRGRPIELGHDIRRVLPGRKGFDPVHVFYSIDCTVHRGCYTSAEAHARFCPTGTRNYRLGSGPGWGVAADGSFVSKAWTGDWGAAWIELEPDSWPVPVMRLRYRGRTSHLPG